MRPCGWPLSSRPLLLPLLLWRERRAAQALGPDLDADSAAPYRAVLCCTVVCWTAQSHGRAAEGDAWCGGLLGAGFGGLHGVILTL